MSRRPRTLDEVKARCERWAAWRASIAAESHGYPPHSWEGRAQERGGAVPCPGGSSIPRFDAAIENPIATQVELAMQSMLPHLRGALERRYLATYCYAPPTANEIAGELGVDLREYHRRVREGLIWLHGYSTAPRHVAW